ncbi:MAG TPA: saccharopine dehydrogenase C-terminal domain-containing protein [Thermoplasmata archaeon]|nr:saccharopine dehydrogenase C-terminal domain-containing protein [Thermoplasmata archaeon]
MRAVVLGGGGLTGRCAVRDLAVGRVFSEVVAADLDGSLAQAAAGAAGHRARPLQLDVRDGSALRAALRGADVCVNAVQYAFNLEVMAACLDARVPVLDFGGLFHMTRRQLEWDARFREAELLAIPGLGQVPGVSNVLAWAATRDLDQVDSVIFRDGWRDLTVGGPELVFTWSPSTFLDEMVLPAQVWEDGAYHPRPAMSEGEEFDFPAPVGKVRVYRTLHSEPATVPLSLADKRLGRCEWKEGGPGIDLLRNLALLGLADTEPIQVGDHPVVPRSVLLALLRNRSLLGYPPETRIDDWEVLDVEVRGRKSGLPVLRHAQARFPPKPEWQLSATEYAVGVCGAIGAELIATGQALGKGVLPPERAVPADVFRRALADRGIRTAIAPPEPGLGTDFRDPAPP